MTIPAIIVIAKNSSNTTTNLFTFVFGFSFSVIAAFCFSQKGEGLIKRMRTTEGFIMIAVLIVLLRSLAGRRQIAFYILISKSKQGPPNLT
jgi:hypothetical protein